MSRPTGSREWPEGDQAGVSAKRGGGGIRPHPLARQPEVDEELLHDARILDRRQQAHSVATLRAGEDVNIEGVPHGLVLIVAFSPKLD
jgi:hypothetical protein